MRAMTGEEFTQYVLRTAERWEKEHGHEPFVPRTRYNIDGDGLELHLDRESYYGQWLSDDVTTLHHFGTKEVCGVQVWGLRKFEVRYPRDLGKKPITADEELPICYYEEASDSVTVILDREEGAEGPGGEGFSTTVDEAGLINKFVLTGVRGVIARAEEERMAPSDPEDDAILLDVMGGSLD